MANLILPNTTASVGYFKEIIIKMLRNISIRPVQIDPGEAVF